MSKTKIVLLIVGIVCIVLIFFWISQPTEAKPEFEILEFTGFDLPSWIGFSYRIAFQIKNIGAGDATDVNGTIKFDGTEQTWSLRENLMNPIPEDYVLKPGRITPRDIIVDLRKKPTSQTIVISVECYEGVTQEFIQILPE